MEKSGASDKIESETGVSDNGVKARTREYTLPAPCISLVQAQFRRSASSSANFNVTH